MTNLIRICESCRRARATRRIEFPASDGKKAAIYHGCGQCSMDLPEDAIVSNL